jgi:ketosteroid isomerase-like protein
MSDSAIEIVDHFLEALQRRDLPAVRALLAPGFRLQAAGREFVQIADFVEFSRSRNGAVRKRPQRFDVAPPRSPDEDVTVVYSLGEMDGHWLDGSAFASIRYLDRFELRGGRIARLDVFSDMAEFRPRAAG